MIQEVKLLICSHVLVIFINTNKSHIKILLCLMAHKIHACSQILELHKFIINTQKETCFELEPNWKLGWSSGKILDAATLLIFKKNFYFNIPCWNVVLVILLLYFYSFCSQNQLLNKYFTLLLTKLLRCVRYSIMMM